MQQPTRCGFISLLGAVAVLTSVGLAACGGGGKSGDVFPPGPTTVGTVSDEVAKSAVVADVNALRRGMGNDAAAAITAMYDMINRAAAIKAPHKGSDMIRTQLPGIIAEYESAYPAARRQVAAVEVRTNGGRAIQRLDLELLDDWHRELPRFLADVARTTDSEWAAVLRFGKRTDKMRARYDGQLQTMLANLPPNQKDMLQNAVKQTFGG